MKRKLFAWVLITLTLGLTSFISEQNQANAETENQQWRKMTQSEIDQEILSIISHKMGIGALNQLALEDFISYDCEKSFYVNDAYSGMQTLMRIKCTSGKGASTAIAFDEVRVIFTRFEGNIEGFEIQRIGEEVDQSTFSLPN
jgi:hypothetical protein